MCYRAYNDIDLRVKYLSKGGIHLNQYDLHEQPSFDGEGYNNENVSNPSYLQHVEQQHMTGDVHDQQRQFQVWGPYVGGLFGQLFPQFGPPGPPGPPFPPPGPPLGRPPFAPPGPPVGPPPGLPAGPPTAPPPAYIPPAPGEVGVFAVDPGAISRCLYRYTYVWLTNRQQFWFYPVFVGRTSVAGYRWTGFFWIYFGIDLRHISSFQCF